MEENLVKIAKRIKYYQLGHMRTEFLYEAERDQLDEKRRNFFIKEANRIRREMECLDRKYCFSGEIGDY